MNPRLQLERRMPLDQEIAAPPVTVRITPDCPSPTAIRQNKASARRAAEAPEALVARSTTTTRPRLQSHQDYARWRARQIAYGRWEPWTDAAPVRDQVRRLRVTGASYHAIARAAGVSPMTVYRLQNGAPPKGHGLPERIRALQATWLLAVTPERLERSTARRDATGARRRLQALIAMGHPATSLARRLDIAPRKVWDIVRAATATITPATHTAVCDLYERMWDLRPPEHTAAERRAAAAARTRAAANGWPTPMGLDDDSLDDPAYGPRSHWHPATGSGVIPERESRHLSAAPQPRPDRHSLLSVTSRQARRTAKPRSAGQQAVR